VSLDAVVVVDKPRGPTSHDVVARVRRALKQRSVGHAGTLDPMATGVLVVALGEATKLVPYLTADDKSYDTTIALGVETDTLDAEGREMKRVALQAPLTGDAIEAALEEERARTEQVPPAFSAIHTGGERAHAKARRGEAIELAPRAVAVRAITLVAFDDASITLRVEVAKGYYVRSLARDLAARLGTVGHLTALRRTRSGAFTLDDAAPLDALASRAIPLAAAASRALPVARLTANGAIDARHGRAVASEDLDAHETGPHAWIDDADALVAVGEIRDGAGRVLRGFHRAR
jgi:tRNA pseudouridine55 synthase